MRELAVYSRVSPVSRESGLILNNVLLLAILSVVFLGTFYPLFVSTTSRDQISVGAPYYNMFFAPMMAVLMIAMAIGPLLSWKRGDLGQAFARLKAAGGTFLVAAGATFFGGLSSSWLLGLALDAVALMRRGGDGVSSSWCLLVR